jgi:hypothetical protein
MYVCIYIWSVCSCRGGNIIANDNIKRVRYVRYVREERMTMRGRAVQVHTYDLFHSIVYTT